MGNQPTFQRIGHRGAPTEFAENTLPSFRQAFARGADAVELDVHATADGVVVVHHDPVIGGGALTTRFRGREIAELTWADVETIELPDEARIPTLAAVLGEVPESSTVYVEIKGRGIEEHVARVLAKAKPKCAVHAFDFGTVETFRRIAPDVPRGLLLDAYPTSLSAAVDRAGAKYVWPEWGLIDRRLVEGAHAAGAQVIAWTVNSREVADELVRLGVDGICTDDLRLME
jgi:glycerophosphoryl diester phosphodiesterase